MCCSVLKWQCCSVLQCVAVRCSVLQCGVKMRNCVCLCVRVFVCVTVCTCAFVWHRAVQEGQGVHCNTMQHCHFNTLQRTSTHCNTLQHTHDTHTQLHASTQPLRSISCVLNHSIKLVFPVKAVPECNKPRNQIEANLKSKACQWSKSRCACACIYVCTYIHTYINTRTISEVERHLHSKRISNSKHVRIF